MTTEGTLRDTTAEAFVRLHVEQGLEEVSVEYRAYAYDTADVLLAALREHLSAHPEAIEELGFVQKTVRVNGFVLGGEAYYGRPSIAKRADDG